MWMAGADEPDWDSMQEEDMIALRAQASSMVIPRPSMVPDLPRVKDIHADGAFGKTRVRLYDPVDDGTPLPALIFLHGGGWVGGSIENRDNGARLLASASRFAVLSVEYALAPERRFPGPLDDVLAVCRWLYKHAGKLGIDPERLAIGGDSSGANLALAAALDLRDANEHFLRALVLFYGVYAHNHNTDSHRLFGRDGRYMLSSASMDCCWRMYLLRPEQDQDPRAAPLLANMSSLPPTYIMCGSLDPLLDDSLRLHSKMTAAGVDASKRIVDGVTHSFLSYVEQLDVSPKLWQEAADFLRGTMH
jgi:acetyl esterase